MKNANLDSNQRYQILDGDDDVLLLGQATFKVGRFKVLVSQKFGQLLGERLENRSGYSVRDALRNLQINEETIIKGGNISWNSPREGIDCQVLKIGSKGWQTGKLKVEVNENVQSWEKEVCLKFLPDELPEQKSPLDDIRQSEEYKKLSNNN